jgi:hypothetical protein
MRASLLTAAALSLTAARPGVSQETTLQRADLPPAVERTVAVESRGATIKGFSKEVEGGKTIYEMALTVRGHGKDISMDSTGAVVLVEEEVALASLPAAVRSSLQSRAAGGRITLVESLNRGGKLVAYEAQVTGKDGKKSEIQVGPDGKALAHPE